MCNCAEKLAQQLSRNNCRHSRNAFVRLKFAMEAYIMPFVVAKEPDGIEELRLSKYGRHEFIRFKYCPVCGKRLPEDYQSVVRWREE